jgi:hypothetical protein
LLRLVLILRSVQDPDPVGSRLFFNFLSDLEFADRIWFWARLDPDQTLTWPYGSLLAYMKKRNGKRFFSSVVKTISVAILKLTLFSKAYTAVKS